MKNLTFLMIATVLGVGLPSCGGCGGQSLVGESVDADISENGNLDDSEGDTAEELHDDLEDLSEMEQQGGCGEPIVLTGAAELNRLLSEMDWPVVGPYTSAHLPITPEMKVEGSLELSGDDFSPPPGWWCFPEDGCRDRVFFYVDDVDVSDIEGVTTVGSDEEMPWIEDYPAVILTDTLVRFRPMLYDVHPAPLYVVVSAIEILPSCDSPCREGESRCPVDSVCYWVDREWGSDYCRLCEALGKETCACWTPGGHVPDGSECQYMMSGDVACIGTCEGGICTSDWDLCH